MKKLILVLLCLCVVSPCFAGKYTEVAEQSANETDTYYKLEIERLKIDIDHLEWQVKSRDIEIEKRDKKDKRIERYHVAMVYGALMVGCLQFNPFFNVISGGYFLYKATTILLEE